MAGDPPFSSLPLYTKYVPTARIPTQAVMAQYSRLGTVHGDTQYMACAVNNVTDFREPLQHLI
jgi:hypothetical protein